MCFGIGKVTICTASHRWRRQNWLNCKIGHLTKNILHLANGPTWYVAHDTGAHANKTQLLHFWETPIDTCLSLFSCNICVVHSIFKLCFFSHSLCWFHFNQFHFMKYAHSFNIFCPPMVQSFFRSIYIMLPLNWCHIFRKNIHWNKTNWKGPINMIWRQFKILWQTNFQ